MEKPSGGLCITRKEGESITILTPEGPIQVKYERQKGAYVRLRINGPRSFKIHRTECMEAYLDSFDENH